MESDRTAAYLGVSLVLFLLALGGWGAFAYSLYSAQEQDQVFRAAAARAETERQHRQTLTTELNQVRSDLTRTQQALERAQADLIVAKAEAEAFAEQIRTRPIQALPTAPARAGRARRTR